MRKKTESTKCGIQLAVGKDKVVISSQFWLAVRLGKTKLAFKGLDGIRIYFYNQFVKGPRWKEFGGIL